MTGDMDDLIRARDRAAATRQAALAARAREERAYAVLLVQGTLWTAIVDYQVAAIAAYQAERRADQAESALRAVGLARWAIRQRWEGRA